VDNVASMLWRRLDGPGHDYCLLSEEAGRHRLQGKAVFLSDEGPAALAYSLECDGAWRSLGGRVSGWVGRRAVEFAISRSQHGSWLLNGEAIAGLETCLDLDYAFTPATNLPQLRRLALLPGQAADAPAAWLQVETGRLSLLPQRYERRDTATYWYEAPSTGYTGLLELAASGFVQLYPGLWQAVA
jgi:hypothetical protein